MDTELDKEFLQLRQRMVDTQIKARGITDERIVSAFLEIPRHKFVPKEKRKYAYEDVPISIGYGQTISQPYMVALMTYLLSPQKDDIVLEIGTGSGYQAAILSLLVRKVYTIERVTELGMRAKRVLEEIGIKNVVFLTGDGSLGWEEFAPYDKIIVAAAAPRIPEKLVMQLREGGRMVVPVGPRSYQRLKVVEKHRGGQISQWEEGLCVFVPLIGEDGWR